MTEQNAGGEATPPASGGTPPAGATPPAGQQPAGSTPPQGGTITPKEGDYSWAGDDTAQQLAKQKGWATPADALKSYSELEGLLGGDKIPLPKAPDDKAGWDRVWSTLGRPDTPDGYGIKPPEGIDPKAATEFSTLAHELGVTKDQAQKLHEWHSKFGSDMMEAQQKETEQRIDKEIGLVKDDWGNNFNTNAEVARRGADALGLDKDTITALEELPAMGHKKLMDMLLKVGQGLSESKMHGQNNAGGFSITTKTQAQARLDEIKNNPVLRDKALQVGTAEYKEVERLDEIIAGGK